MSADPQGLPWRGRTTLEYPSVVIELANEAVVREGESERGRFLLAKSRDMVTDMMDAVHQIEIRNILDLGIWKGGSVVFLNECFKPAKLVALDFQPAPSVLREYAEAQEGDRLEIHDQVDQADGARLEAICDAAFGAERIDLIVDDASHLYAQTRTTFSYLFPRLREGGLYIIEDWGWAHWPAAHWQKERGGEYFAEELPLSNLLMEIMLLTASRQHAFTSIEVTARAAYIKRGPESIDAPLELDQLVLNRGDPLSWIGSPREC